MPGLRVMWLFWLPLLIVLWFHVIGLGLFMFAPQWVRAIEERRPRLVRAIERGQMVVSALMLIGMTIAVTVLAVWMMYRSIILAGGTHLAS
jgi:membrane glycosyltransferase